jgi:hypothetical protein
MDYPRLPPHAERIAQNRISFGRKMGFGKDRIIGLVADAIMETFAPFTATMEDYDAVKAWAANRCEE